MLKLPVKVCKMQLTVDMLKIFRYNFLKSFDRSEWLIIHLIHVNSVVLSNILGTKINQ